MATTPPTSTTAPRPLFRCVHARAQLRGCWQVDNTRECTRVHIHTHTHTHPPAHVHTHVSSHEATHTPTLRSATASNCSGTRRSGSGPETKDGFHGKAHKNFSGIEKLRNRKAGQTHSGKQWLFRAVFLLFHRKAQTFHGKADTGASTSLPPKIPLGLRSRQAPPPPGPTPPCPATAPTARSATTPT